MKARRDNSENERHFLEFHRKNEALILQCGAKLMINQIRKTLVLWLENLWDSSMDRARKEEIHEMGETGDGNISLWPSSFSSKFETELVWPSLNPG